MTPELVLAARAVLAGVLIAAAVAKALDRQGSMRAAAGLGVPERLTPGVGVALPVIEAAAAFLLLLPDVAVAGALVAVALLLAFTVVLAVNLAGGRRPSCHCFGQSNNAPINATSLIRNASLLALAVVALGDPGPAASLAVPALAAAVVAQGVLLAPMLKHQTRPVSGDRPQSDDVAGLPVGALAPEFDLPDLNGGRHTLAELRRDGRAVLLTFTDPHCGPCQAIGPEIADWRRRFADRVEVVVISAGEGDDVRAKADDAGLELVLTQPGTVVAEAYHYAGTPSAVLVGADGRIASVVASGAPDIRRLVADSTASLPSVWAPLAAPAGAPPVRAIGDPAPFVDLRAPDGTQVSLGLMAGRMALVVFWDPNCAHCEAMLGDWRAWETTRPEPLGVLVVSAGEADAVAGLGLTSLIGLDPDGLTRRAFGADGAPMAVLVDATGRIASPIGAGRDEVLALAERARKLAILSELMPASTTR